MVFLIILCAACYAVIEFFFDDYYYAQQKQVLLDRIQHLTVHYDEQGIDALQDDIDMYYSEYGISVNFLDVDSNRLYGAAMRGMGMHGLSAVMQPDNVGKFFVSDSGMGMGQDTSWLSYLTQTQDANLILGRVSFESMNSVVHIVQQFLLYFGIAITLSFLIFAFLFARSISRPLRKLNNIAFEMGKLNFSMQYEGRRIDEIGQLGNTLNSLTRNLENTITQLKGELSKEKTLEKMRTDFTAQVSHELQTPLSVIKGYAEALVDNVYAADETSEVYSILLTEAEKISHMVDDLLDLSQMEAGVYVVRKKEFSLYNLIQKVYDHYHALPNDNRFTLSLNTDYPKDAMWFGDPLRIEQAIRNILTNAIKHVTDGGNIKIWLVQANNKTKLSVENDGAHIPGSELNRIFDSYYQGKTHTKGAGLGLAITRHIVKLHDGEIIARNTDSGVIFDIILPN